MRHAKSPVKALALSLGLLALGALGALGVDGAQAQTPDPVKTPASAAAPGANWPHTAQCAAVMKREAVGLADRYKAGDTALKPGMVLLAEDSFALLGTAYKQGLRKAEADRLLADAERDTASEPAAAQRQLLGECRSEGRQLFKDANFVERAIVSNRARARVEQLVKP